MSDDQHDFPIPAPVLRAIAHATPEGYVPSVRGFEIEAVPSFRGETRVWYVRREHPSARWYVKRLRDPRAYKRYLEALRILERNAAPGSILMPVREAGHHDSFYTIAMFPVPGSSAKRLFERGARFDKLFSWMGSDLPGLARRIGRGLQVLWGHRCDIHPDLVDYGPGGTAERIVVKCERLRYAAPDSWSRFYAAVTCLVDRLKSVDNPSRSFLLGDLTLDNLLLFDGRVGVFDLDDVGTGDWRRDVACLMQRLSEAEENIYYSRRRVRQFRKALLDEVGLEFEDPVLAMYRIEFYLDMLWSSRCYKDDRSLPIMGLSSEMVERQMERHLEGLRRAN